MYFFDYGTVNGTIVCSGDKWLIFKRVSGTLLNDGRTFHSRAAALAAARAAR